MATGAAPSSARNIIKVQPEKSRMLVLDERLLEPIGREAVNVFERSRIVRLVDQGYAGLFLRYPDFVKAMHRSAEEYDAVGSLECDIKASTNLSGYLERERLRLSIRNAITADKRQLDNAFEMLDAYEQLSDVSEAALALQQQYLVALVHSIKGVSASFGIPAVDVVCNRSFDNDIYQRLFVSGDTAFAYLRRQHELEVLEAQQEAHLNALLVMHRIECPEPPPTLPALRLKQLGELTYHAVLFHGAFMQPIA